MDWHEEFRELCAAASAGELSDHEQAKLTAHLAGCADCRRLKSEYESAAIAVAAALADSHLGDPGEGVSDSSWSVKQAEEKFFGGLAQEDRLGSVVSSQRGNAAGGRRH